MTRPIYRHRTKAITVITLLLVSAILSLVVFPPPFVAAATPTTIGTTTAATPFTNGGDTNQVFYAQGLWWVVYFDGTNYVYRTSSDGSTWSGSSTLRSGTGTYQQGYAGGYEYTNTKFCYAIVGSTTTNVLVRCGSLSSGGAITLYSSEQTVTFGTGCACNNGGTTSPSRTTQATTSGSR